MGIRNISRYIWLNAGSIKLIRIARNQVDVITKNLINNVIICILFDA